MIRKTLVLAALLIWLAPIIVSAAFTENSPEFREVTSQLNMDGHAEHDVTTCKVRKAYNSEILEMLNHGLPPEKIIKRYKDELGQAALKVPDHGGGGLAAWVTPGIGAIAGGTILILAIRKMTARKKQEELLEQETLLYKNEFHHLEEVMEAERKKHF